VLVSAALGLLLIGQLNSFEFTPIASPQYAGDSFNISIIAKDAAGNIYNYNRPAFLSTSRGAIYIYPNVIGPFRNGVWQGRVVITLAESLQITCTDDSFRVTSTSNVFQVLPGAPATFRILLPGQQLSPGTLEGRLGQPDNQTAGDTFSIRVYLTDNWSNPVSNRTDSVCFGATDSFARLPSGGVMINGSGSFTVSLRRAGQHRLFALPAPGQSYRADTSSVFRINPGAFNRLLLLLPGEIPLPGDTTQAAWQSPGKSGTPLPQFVREPFPVVVYGCDECWNRIRAPEVSISLHSEFPVEFVPAETVLTDSAVFSAQFNSAGANQDIWVSATNGGYESYHTRLEIKARGRRILVSAPDTVFAGETAYIRVIVRDANEQPITATVCHFEVVKGNGEMLDQTLLTDTLGSALARFLCTRSRFAEFDSIRITSGIADTSIAIYVSIPDSSLLSGKIIAFPNPFGFNRAAAEIYYYLNRSSAIDFRIYDPFGNEVLSRSFRAGEEGGKAGVNRIYWDGHNLEGRRVASGIYVIQVIGELHTGTTFKSTYRLGVVW
jgi:hypothetical protein